MEIALTEWQHDFAMCDGPRYLVAMVGRGGGKTNALMARATRLCTTYPKFQYMYVSPVLDLAEECFEEMTGNPQFMKHVRRATNKKYPQIDFKNKSCWKGRSMQRPQGLRGKNINELGLDEIQNPIYTENHFHRILNPMVRGPSPVGNFGTVCMAGQFGNLWVKEQFYDFGSPTLDDGEPNPRYQPHMWRSWRIPASQGFIYQQGDGPADYLRRRDELIQAGKLGEWNQEYECLPTASIYAAFPSVQIDAVSKDLQYQIGGDERYPRRLQMEEPRPNVSYLVCVDMGRRIDPTAVLVGDAAGNVVHEEEYRLGQEHAISARDACKTCVRYNMATLILDVTGGANPGKSSDEQDAFVKFYREEADKYGITVRAVYQNQANKNRMVENLGLKLQARGIAIPRECVKTLAQMKAYEYKPNKHDNKIMGYGGPLGTHDDFVSCLYMYVEGLIRGWAEQPRGATYRVY